MEKLVPRVCRELDVPSPDEALRPGRPGRLDLGAEAEETAMTETEIIFSVEESPEGGFEARAFGCSIYTEAETMDELRATVQNGVRCHFDERERPRPIRLHMVRDEVLPFEPAARPVR